MTIRRFLLWSLLAAVLAAGTLAAFGWVVWRRLHEPYRGWSVAAVRIQVEPGEDAGTILRSLQRHGVLEETRWTRLYLVHVLDDPPLQAGEYVFEEAVAPVEVLEKLISGDVATHAVTLVEGWNRWQIARQLDAAGFGDEARFVELFASPARIRDLAPEAASLEGYLYPDTYRLTRSMTPEQIVDVLVDTFRERFEQRVRPRVAERSEVRTVHEIVTLASIVEKEAAVDRERPLISGVYQNRLRRGMALYADPTLIYGRILAGDWDGNLTRRDLRTDGPYNTYLRPGLPPGPICSPGLDSLVAAAAPADVPWLYFVSRNDGTHVFATNLREHSSNVEEWQRRYWRRRDAPGTAAPEGDEDETGAAATGASGPGDD